MHKTMTIINNGKNWVECLVCGTLAKGATVPFLTALSKAHKVAR